jgi:peptidoglycan/xylan/chitin deacetylase (PgdA/CDA1 family)
MNNNLTILLYHGVTDTVSYGIENYSKKHIHIEDFEKQMHYIKNKATVLSMDEVVDIYNSGRDYPDNAVAITFDDGFANNYTHAVPVLDGYKIPATFYITSGVVSTDIMFWVDQLEDMINLCSMDSISIELDKGKNYVLKSFQDKIKALSDIKSYCKSEPNSEKNRIIKELSSITSVQSDVHHSNNYKKITWSQIKEMDQNPLFIIGGHSLYHNILNSMNEVDMKKDIKISIDLLEYNLEKKVEHYSYPEGQKEHYDDHVVSCLKSFGIKCSPSAIDGVNHIGTQDMFNLRRIMVGIFNAPFPELITK